jgi:hypothetical protein
MHLLQREIGCKRALECGWQVPHAQNQLSNQAAEVRHHSMTSNCSKQVIEEHKKTAFC